MAFSLTYNDYASNHPQEMGGSEGGQGTSSLLSEDAWNNLSDTQKWQAVGGGLALTSSDPRYAAIAQGLDFSGGNGHLANTLQISPGAYKPGMLTNNKNQVDLGNGVNATNWGNYTPLGQRSDTSSNFFHDAGPALAIVGALFGGAALAGAAGLGGGAAVSGAEATAAGGITGGADIAGSGGLASSGLGAGTMTGLAGDESAGLSMSNPFAEAGNPFGPGAFDEGGSTGFGGSSALNGNSSLLQQLNTGRQYFNGARSAMNLLSGGQGQAGQRSGGMGSTDLSSLISSLFGGSGGSGGALGGILGLLANGHSMFGGGIGTASGAQAAADKASGMADPWGQSGRRQQFNDLLTPDRAMSLMSQDPSQILNNPAYQFDLKQGTNAINMGDAAQGTLRSGNRGYELQDYGQGLAAKYGQQYFNNNMSVLNAMSGLAGVNASSPTAAGQIQMNGFDNASNIRNAGVNSTFGGGSSNPLMGGIGSLLTSLGGNAAKLWDSISGNGGFDMSSVDFGNLPNFNDTSGWDPSQFFNYDNGSSSLADATGAFF